MRKTGLKKGMLPSLCSLWIFYNMNVISLHGMMVYPCDVHTHCVIWLMVTGLDVPFLPIMNIRYSVSCFVVKRPEVRSASSNWMVTIWLITRRIYQSMSQMTFKIIFFLRLKRKFPAVKIFAFFLLYFMILMFFFSLYYWRFLNICLTFPKILY